MVRPVRRYASFLSITIAVAALTPAVQAKEPHPIVQLARKLAEPVDFPGIDDPKTTLREALDLLTRLYGVRFDVNERAFLQPGGPGAAAAQASRVGGNDLFLVVAHDKPAPLSKPGPGVKGAAPTKPTPAAPPTAAGPFDVANVLVAAKPIPKMTRVRLDTVLKKVLASAPAELVGMTYVLRRDGVEITTVMSKQAEFYNQGQHAINLLPPPDDATGASDPFQYLPLVQCEFDKRPLADALKELADATDWNVVLDARAAKQAEPVTASLINLPLDTAVGLLANMSGLAVVSRDRALYVTTKDNAVVMQKELRDRVTPALPPGALFPGGLRPGGMGPGGVGPGVVPPASMLRSPGLEQPPAPKGAKTAPAARANLRVEIAQFQAERAQRRQARSGPKQEK